MFNLLTLGIGILSIVALAKINKSNKLFWTFLVSMFIGYAGGSIVGKLNSVGKKKVGTTYVAPMHEFQVLTTDCPALPEDTLVAYGSNHASRNTYYMGCDMVPTRTGKALNPEDDTGNVDTENTS